MTQATGIRPPGAAAIAIFGQYGVTGSLEIGGSVVADSTRAARTMKRGLRVQEYDTESQKAACCNPEQAWRLFEYSTHGFRIG